jgi:hypothetical protein
VMKIEHALYVTLGLVALYVALESFYTHPTYGRGVKAVLTAANLASIL